MARKRISPEDTESDGERRRKRRKSLDEEDDANQWVEKGGEVVLVPKQEDVAKILLPPEPIVLPDEAYTDDEEVGPHLPVEYTGRDGKIDRTA